MHTMSSLVKRLLTKQNILLLFVSSFFVLAASELFLYLQKERFFPACKAYLSNTIHCYPSLPDGLKVVDLNSPAGISFARRYLMQESPEKLARLVKQTPYCQRHDIVQKQNGAFPDREENIILVGDSFTFGEGVNEDGTLSTLLGGKLQNFNFKNYGVSQNNVRDVYDNVQMLMKGQGMKNFIYFYNLNDLLLSSELEKMTNRINDLQKVEIGCGAEGIERPLFWSLIKRTSLLLYKTSETVKNYHQMYFGESNRVQFETSMAYLKRMHNQINSSDGSFLLVIYPLLYKDYTGNYPFSDIHEKIIAWCKQEQILCVDGAQAFKDFDSMKPFRVHQIDYHPNKKSNRLLVDFLFKQSALSNFPVTK